MGEFSIILTPDGKQALPVCEACIASPNPAHCNPHATAFLNDLEGIQNIRYQKLSDVVWDDELGLWTATDRKTNLVIAKGVTRSECVRNEQNFYDGEIAKGRLPWKENIVWHRTLA